VRGYGKSVKGWRVNNEDRILVDNSLKLYVVADGLGGEIGGEMAGEIVVETFREYKKGEEPKKELLRLTKLSHERIRKMIKKEPLLEGMSSTVVAAKIHNNKAFIINVGDSAAFLLRKEELRMLTPLDRGSFSFLVTQAIGFDIRNIHETEVEIRNEDKLLLCSDGLIDNLTNEEIREILLRRGSLESVVDDLIEEAVKKKRQPDNISVILIS
jgi:protein phosphatase